MARYLLDTNMLVNIFENDYIHTDIQHILSDNNNVFYTCSECVKEFIHLVQIGKVGGKKRKQQINVLDFIENELCYTVKYVSKEHLKTLANLVIFDKHRDPSDRLIVAHAIIEKIPIISSDSRFQDYKPYGLKLVINKK
jgi:PIN domain nuclease of toxin-antitoxin system